MTWSIENLLKILIEKLNVFKNIKHWIYFSNSIDISSEFYRYKGI